MVLRVLGRDGLKDRERPERRESRPRVAVVRRERKFLSQNTLLHSCLPAGRIFCSIAHFREGL